KIPTAKSCSPTNRSRVCCIAWCRGLSLTRSCIVRSIRCISASQKSSGTGRVVLAGDAAHINNPLGGMGMNGGMQDAFNLADKFKDIGAGADARLLDRYHRQRRTVAVEAVQEHTHRNQQIISERDPEIRRKSLDAMRRIAADKGRRTNTC